MVVLDDVVPRALKGERAVENQLLARVLAGGLGPAELARVALHVEVLAVLGAAEAEHYGNANAAYSCVTMKVFPKIQP